MVTTVVAAPAVAGMVGMAVVGVRAAGVAVVVAGPEAAMLDALLLPGAGLLLASLLAMVLVDLHPGRARAPRPVQPRPPIDGAHPVAQTLQNGEPGAGDSDGWAAHGP
jgi:hypothetical protein